MLQVPADLSSPEEAAGASAGTVSTATFCLVSRRYGANPIQFLDHGEPPAFVTPLPQQSPEPATPSPQKRRREEEGDTLSLGSAEKQRRAAPASPTVSPRSDTSGA